MNKGEKECVCERERAKCVFSHWIEWIWVNEAKKSRQKKGKKKKKKMRRKWKKRLKALTRN